MKQTAISFLLGAACTWALLTMMPTPKTGAPIGDADTAAAVEARAARRETASTAQIEAAASVRPLPLAAASPAPSPRVPTSGEKKEADPRDNRAELPRDARKRELAVYRASLPPERLRLIDGLSAKDVATWREDRKADVDTFLHSPSQKFWTNGPDLNANFNFQTLSAAVGTYDGTLNFNGGTGGGRRSSPKLTLSLTDAQGTKATNRIVIRGNHGTFTQKFKLQNLGTDAESKNLTVVWANARSDSSLDYSQLGLSLPPNVQTGASFTATLVGLTEDLEWATIGTANLRKTQ